MYQTNNVQKVITGNIIHLYNKEIKETKIVHSFTKEEIENMKNDLINVQLDPYGVECKYNGEDSNDFMMEQRGRFATLYSDAVESSHIYDMKSGLHFSEKLSTKTHMMWLAKEATLPYSKAFMPAVTKDGHGKDEDFISQNVFALDFDKGIKIEEVIEICEKYCIPINFIYTTFSHTDTNHRFRVVFADEYTHTSIFTRNIITQSFIKIFRKELDTAPLALGAIVQGGKEIVYENYDARINTKIMLDAVSMFLKDKDNKKFKRNIERFAKKIKVVLDKNGFFNIDLIEKEKRGETDVILLNNINRTTYDTPLFQNEIQKLDKSENDIKQTLFYYINNRSGENYSITMNVGFEIVENVQAALKELKGYSGECSEESKQFCAKLNADKKNKIPELCQKCMAMKAVDEDNYTDYSTRLIVASNVNKLYGGRDWFLDKMESTKNDYDKNVRFWEHEMNSWDRKYDMGFPCEFKDGSHVCQFKDECEHAGMILFLFDKRKEVKFYDRPVLQDFNTVRNAVNDKTNELVVMDNKQLNVIKAEAGIGKTFAYTRAVANNPDKTFLIIVPRHDIIEEVAQELNGLGVNFSKPENISQYINKLTEEEISMVELIYHKGAGAMANAYLASLAKKAKKEWNQEAKERLEALETLMDILDKNKKAMETDGNLIITHSRFVFMDEIKQDQIIVDEDFLLTNSVVKRNETYTDHLDWFIGHQNNSKESFDIVEFIHTICNVKDHEFTKTPDIKVGFNRFFKGIISDNKINSNIISLFSSKYFYKDKNFIHYINFDLKDVDKTIILFSATADEWIYKKMFEMVKFHDFGYVKHKGKIEQYMKYSNSRNCLGNNDKAMEYINENLVLNIDLKIITFKSMLDDFDDSIANFGGCSGLNEYKGFNIAIVGTPVPHPSQVYFLASLMGIDVNKKSLKMKWVNCKWKGIGVKRYTFEDEDLRNIQFYLIESEIIQAIGRARTISNECTVYVFSDFPLHNTEIFGKTVVNVKNAEIVTKDDTKNVVSNTKIEDKNGKDFESFKNVERDNKENVVTEAVNEIEVKDNDFVVVSGVLKNGIKEYTLKHEKTGKILKWMNSKRHLMFFEEGSVIDIDDGQIDFDKCCVIDVNRAGTLLRKAS